MAVKNPGCWHLGECWWDVSSLRKVLELDAERPRTPGLPRDWLTPAQRRDIQLICDMGFIADAARTAGRHHEAIKHNVHSGLIKIERVLGLRSDKRNPYLSAEAQEWLEETRWRMSAQESAWWGSAMKPGGPTVKRPDRSRYHNLIDATS